MVNLKQDLLHEVHIDLFVMNRLIGRCSFLEFECGLFKHISQLMRRLKISLKARR